MGARRSTVANVGRRGYGPQQMTDNGRRRGTNMAKNVRTINVEVALVKAAVRMGASEHADTDIVVDAVMAHTAEMSIRQLQDLTIAQTNTIAILLNVIERHTPGSRADIIRQMSDPRAAIRELRGDDES